MSSTTTNRPEETPKPQRDANGRFARGNSGGPGNPFGRRLAQLRECLLRSATEENIERLANMLMAKAFDGDMAAAKLLLLYWIGKPKEVVEPDRVEVEEWELAREHVVRPDVAQETFASMPITVGIAALPALAEVQEKEFVDRMLHPENYSQEGDEEPTAEELREEAEMIREMKAARERAAARPAASDCGVGPTPAAAHDAREAGSGASRSPSPIGDIHPTVAHRSRQGSSAAGRSPSPIGEIGPSPTPVRRPGVKAKRAA